MITRFLEQIKTKIKAYNKSNKDKLSLDLFDKTRFEMYVLDVIDDLVVVDIISNDIELHVRLVSFIDSVLNSDEIAKGKHKHVKAVVDDLTWLVQWHRTHVDKDVDNQAEINAFDRYLYSLPEFAKHRVNDYVNTLLSKTIDYLPKHYHHEFDKLEPTIAMFDLFKQKLNELAESQFIMWVYAYTENLRYVPIRLRYLDAIDGLGSRVETWIDSAAFTPLTAHLNERGYDVFSGWGNLSAIAPKLTADDGVKVVLSDEEGPKELPPMSTEQLHKCMEYAIRITHMYITNPLLNMHHVQNQENYIYTIAIPIYFYSDGCKLTIGDVKRVMQGIKAHYKNTKYYRQRKWKDRNLWFAENHYDFILKRVDYYRSNPHIMYATNVAMHCFDCATSITKEEWDKGHSWEDIIDGHHTFLARSYNELFHGERDYSDAEIREMVNYFNSVLIPRYLPLIKPERQWLLNSSMEFWFNIENNKKADDTYDGLRLWFSERHSTEENQKQYDEIRGAIKLLSYRVKERLMKRLDEEPISLVSYGGSKDKYESIYHYIKEDVINPNTTGRIRNLETEGEQRHVSI